METGVPGSAKTTLIIHQIGKTATTATQIATIHFRIVQPGGRQARAAGVAG